MSASNSARLRLLPARWAYSWTDSWAYKLKRLSPGLFVGCATFFDFINPGYTPKLDKRARVLLSGQTVAGKNI
jgi:hypothetical protein